jgi:hypothetical protein
MKQIKVTVYKKNACILLRPDWHKILKNCFFFFKAAAEQLRERKILHEAGVGM